MNANNRERGIKKRSGEAGQTVYVAPTSSKKEIGFLRQHHPRVSGHDGGVGGKPWAPLVFCGQAK